MTIEDFRNAPLPRMAGHLSFMRARRIELAGLVAGDLAILGAPLESSAHRTGGFRFAPRALRETSVYFGWHANAQFSHPIDIDERAQIDTSSIHDRLVDLGDLAIEDMPPERAGEALATVLQAIDQRAASSIVLGGDSGIVAPALAAHGLACNRLGFIRFGGEVPVTLFEQCVETLCIAPHGRIPVEASAQTLSAGRCVQMSDADWKECFGALDQRCDGLVLQLDLSVLRTPLHGLADAPRLHGLRLADLQRALVAIGQAKVRCLLVTGLNPTVNGMSIVKTGQRLLVTGLLGYIYARLGLLQT